MIALSSKVDEYLKSNQDVPHELIKRILELGNKPYSDREIKKLGDLKKSIEESFIKCEQRFVSDENYAKTETEKIMLSTYLKNVHDYVSNRISESYFSISENDKKAWLIGVIYDALIHHRTKLTKKFIKPLTEYKLFVLVGFIFTQLGFALKDKKNLTNADLYNSIRHHIIKHKKSLPPLQTNFEMPEDLTT
jgi:hypothetical protein